MSNTINRPLRAASSPYLRSFCITASRFSSALLELARHHLMRGQLVAGLAVRRVRRQPALQVLRRRGLAATPHRSGSARGTRPRPALRPPRGGRALSAFSAPAVSPRWPRPAPRRGARRGLLRVHLPRGVEQRPRPFDVALHEVLVALRRQLVRLVGDVAVDELADIALGQGAGELVDDLAVAEQLHRRDAADAELLGQLLLLLGVDLRDDELDRGTVGELASTGMSIATGAAPLGPEVDEDRTLARAAA